MFNWWITLFLFCLLLNKSFAQMNDDNTDEYDNIEDNDDNNNNNEDDDYTQPGAPTEDCICVPFYQCENGEIVSDGRNAIDPRKKPQTEELPVEEKYIPPACGPYHVCCRDPEAVTVRPYEHRCGTRNPSGINGRILSAHADGEAEFGEWPWQALILKKEGDEFVLKCGGTLIDNYHVLTVAHCVDEYKSSPDSLVVRLGEWDTQVATEFMEHEDYDITGIVVHSEYRKKSLFNDIAVLKLAEPVNYKPHIDSVCLPHDDDDFTGHECVVTGWGTDAYQSSKYSLIMKEIAIPVISNAECQKQLRKTRLGRYFKLFGNFMCAGGEKGKDSCKGDGGGPLVCYDKKSNSYALAGLVSWGIECGHEGIPGVYVNVKKYIDWISSVTGSPVEQYWNSR